MLWTIDPEGLDIYRTSSPFRRDSRASLAVSVLLQCFRRQNFT